MLDIKMIINDTVQVKQKLKRKNVDISIIDKIVSLYQKIVENNKTIEELRTKRNQLSKEIGILKSQKKDATDIMAQVKEISPKIKESEKENNVIEKEYQDLILSIPNLPDDVLPEGNEENNKEISSFMKNERKTTAIPHYEIGETLNILDFKTGAKLVGSRFTVLKNQAAKLERALINFMLDIHTEEHGYAEILPPFMVNKNALLGTGQLPKFEEDLFKVEPFGYYLVPTAEVPLTNIHNNEILNINDLPKKICAFTPCFRAEAGTWGQDTRGIIRQHQFNKVELMQFVLPEQSDDALQELLKQAEKILQLLKLPYRVVLLAAGDTGFSAARTYDIEVWFPSQNKYREISSCSNFRDFQARRAQIRFRRDNKSKPEFLNTINGSGLAVGRTLAAILENYQESENSIKIPEVLHKYTGFTHIKI